MIGQAEFVVWIERKSDMLYRVARTILRNDEDCKDALQETVLKAWANRHKLRDRELFGTWITRILINECHTLGRRKRGVFLREATREEIGEEPTSNAPDPALHWALESLPEKLRLPLVLHYLEGYSYEEIAAMLHIPQSTVRSRLSRARNALRLEMEAEKEARTHEAH